jgi:hypothetical protein
MIKRQVLDACRHLLLPVVRLLIRNGVTFSEFSELGKELFVDVARRDYGLQGRPTNSARVALLTGLSRREVGKLKNVLVGHSESHKAPEDRISRVLTNWHVDPDFLDSSGQPLALSETGESTSIEALFKRHAGDTPHGALLKELTHLGLVVVEDGVYRVTSRNYVRAQADPNMIYQAGVTLHDHGATVVHNCDAERSGAARFDRMATSISFPIEQVHAFNRLVEREGQSFLEAMDHWLAEHEDSGSNNDTAGTVRVGVGVYLINNESNSTSDDDRQ